MQLYHPRMIKAREPTLVFHTRVVGLESVSAVFSDKSAQAQFYSLPLFGRLKALKISSISSLGTGTERRRRRRSHCSTEQVLEDIYRFEHRQQSMNGSENLGLSLSMATAQRKEKLIHLFYCAEMEELARNIASLSESIHLYPINWRNFPDGFPHLFIPNAHGIRGQNVAFLASFSSPAVIFEQVSVIYNLPRMFVSSFTLVLPFFPTGTFERVEQEGDVATAFTLARILSNIPISRGGPTSLVTFDIHALQERFYFGDNVLPCFESGIPLLKQRLQQFPSSENIAIAFPDDGAWKRFHTLLSDFPMVVCTKVREGSKRIVRVKEGIAAGYHVVIVDDLVQSGGTLIECQKVLAAHGAKKISAYVTHGVFPNQSWKRFQSDNGNGAEHGFSYFWISDSCPQTAMAVKDHQPFEVLSLAGPIASALQI